MPTGAGKSLCYQIPALVCDRLAVIVSPLVALMDDQVAGLRANGVAAACVHSGLSREEQVANWRSVASGQCRLLYLSPERLMTPRMLEAERVVHSLLDGWRVSSSREFFCARPGQSAADFERLVHGVCVRAVARCRWTHLAQRIAARFPPAPPDA
jgi:hypothetical protein